MCEKNIKQRENKWKELTKWNWKAHDTKAEHFCCCCCCSCRYFFIFRSASVDAFICFFSFHLFLTTGRYYQYWWNAYSANCTMRGIVCSHNFTKVLQWEEEKNYTFYSTNTQYIYTRSVMWYSVYLYMCVYIRLGTLCEHIYVKMFCSYNRTPLKQRLWRRRWWWKCERIQRWITTTIASQSIVVIAAAAAAVAACTHTFECVWNNNQTSHAHTQTNANRSTNLTSCYHKKVLIAKKNLIIYPIISLILCLFVHFFTLFEMWNFFVGTKVANNTFN